MLMLRDVGNRLFFDDFDPQDFARGSHASRIRKVRSMALFEF